MKRFLPEWYPQQAILMAMPKLESDWGYILSEAQSQYERIIKSLTDEDIMIVLLCQDAEGTKEILKNCRQDKIIYVVTDYNDTWTRDYGPITVIEGDHLSALDFGFNGWGLKFASDKDNLVNLNLRNMLMLSPETYCNKRAFILEGGSVETDGKGTLLTTTRCLCSPNRNGGLSKSKVMEKLESLLGVDHFLFLDYGYLEGDDTDSHIDTLARLAPGDIILFTGCRDQEDPHFEELLKMRAQLTLFRTPEGTPFNLIELPLPDPIFDENGERLPATYANYLVTDRVVFMPIYNQPEKDLLAMQTIRIAFPDLKVKGIDSTTLIKQHGSLHCATMQLPKDLFIL